MHSRVWYTHGMEDTKRLQLTIPEDMIEDWKRYASRKGVPVSAWVISCVQNALTFGPAIADVHRKLDLLLGDQEEGE